jgi:hypothetical protein
MEINGTSKYNGMKVYFKKPWREYKPGSYDLWDAKEALKSGCAVPYDKRYSNESQTEPEAEPQSAGKDKTAKAKTIKKSN